MKLVVLDPGHSYTNTSNRSPDGSYYEWEFNQDVCDRAKRIIDRIDGLMCILTKGAQDVVGLAGRVAVAHDAKADLFISQHSNAYGMGEWTSPNGFGVYRYPGKNLELARIGLKWCRELLPMNDRGIRERNLYVIREPQMPSILFETGFHTNREDVEKLKDSGFRDLAAMVLVRTSCEFLGIEYTEGEYGMTPFHDVVSGDRMGNIAKNNNLTLDVLMGYNPHIDDASVIYAEHGGDRVYLEQPTEFEVEYATLRRALIFCKRDTEQQGVDIKVLEDQLQSVSKDLKREKLLRAGAETEVMKVKDAGRTLIGNTTTKLQSYAPIFE